MTDTPVCCRPLPSGASDEPCTWPATDCYENGPARQQPVERLMRILVRDATGALLATYVAKEPMLPLGPFRVTILLDREQVADTWLAPVIRAAEQS